MIKQDAEYAIRVASDLVLLDVDRTNKVLEGMKKSHSDFFYNKPPFKHSYIFTQFLLNNIRNTFHPPRIYLHGFIDERRGGCKFKIYSADDKTRCGICNSCCQ